MRKARIERKTKETEIKIELNLDGNGKSKICTGIGFFDHMLELLAKNSLIDLTVKAKGDLKRDDHHLIEDTGIALGKAVNKALGEKKGIKRYGFEFLSKTRKPKSSKGKGFFVLPMDESLAMTAIDLSGRFWLEFNAEFNREKVNDLSTEAIQEFFKAFAENCKCSLHIKLFYGGNEHHKIEAIFKCFGRALRNAIENDPRVKGIPSTKEKL
jgi:imidazoleglycerol-phosphate dehydratase